MVPHRRTQRRDDSEVVDRDALLGDRLHATAEHGVYTLENDTHQTRQQSGKLSISRQQSTTTHTRGAHAHTAYRQVSLTEISRAGVSSFYPSQSTTPMCELACHSL